MTFSDVAMYEFYVWPWPARLAVTFLLALCVLAQSLAAVLSFYALKRRMRALLNLCALALILFCSLLYGQIINGFSTGLVAPVGYGALRLPMEGRAWAWLFVGALLFLLARGIYTSLKRYREITTGISALSIKSAMDSLRTGVLFSEPDGFTLLSNAKMQWLMTALTGNVQRNSRDFYSLLAHGELQPGCRKAEFEGQVVCLLPDHSAWMFTQTELHIRKKTYIQLTAADITERWELTEQLRRQNAQLRQRGEELKSTIANLHILSRERETQKAKMRAHDILGQCLSLLLCNLRGDGGQAPDYGLLRALSQGLMDELKAGAPSPRDALDSLRQAFGAIGVEILPEGALPEDSAKAQLFVDIIREGATNAVRHGFATQVFVRMEESCLRIADNGPPPPGIFEEGGGLGSIRKKAALYGGALRVQSRPRFVLEIDFPGGDLAV